MGIGDFFRSVGRGIVKGANAVNQGLKQTKIISRVLPAVLPGVGGVVGSEIAKATGYQKGGRVLKGMRKGGKVKKAHKKAKH